MGKRTQSWTNRMILLLLLVTVIPTIILATVISNLALARLEQQAYALMEYRSDEKARFLEMDIKRVFDLLYQITSDKSAMSAMNGLRLGKDSVMSKVALRQHFIGYAQMFQDVQSIAFIAPEAIDYYTYEKFNGAYHNAVLGEDTRRLEIWNMASQADHAVIVPTVTETLVGGRTMQIFYIALPLQDYITDDVKGVLVLGLGMDFFENLEDYAQDYNETLQIIDAAGYIIFSSDAARIGMQIQESDEVDSSQFRMERKIKNADLTLVSCIDHTGLQKEASNLRHMILAMVFIFVVLFIAVVLQTSRYFTKNLNALSECLKKLGEGNVGMQIQTNIRDEFYPFVLQFNSMSSSIARLLKSISAEKQRSEHAMTMQRKAEIRALEAQINPHFLYNTLDCINWTAIENEQYQISDMLSSLASLLRYSVSGIDSLVTVSQEEQWLNHYLFLQQKRFANRLSYDVHIAPETQDIRVHKMLLQPLLENCMIHGFEGIKEGGKVEIASSVCRAGMVRFTIADNGCGMAADVVERLNEFEDDGCYLGVKNVQKRLQSYYGSGARMWFESEIQVGTRVTVDIPYEEGHADEDTSGGG